MANHEVQTALVSVIIPVFNDRDGLLKCLFGLQNAVADVYSMEIVVVDNNSSPLLDPDARYPMPVRIIRCSTPGSYAARNSGVRAATGNVLAFTDADCVPCAGWLTQGIRTLTEGEGAIVVGGDVVFSTPDKRTGTALYQLAVGFQQAENIKHKGFAATANLFCTRSQFEMVGPFHEQLLSGGDREWCWRAAKYGISVRFEPAAVVSTHPRVRLRDAVRQSRRIAAGRSELTRHRVSNPQGVARYRSATQSGLWIMSLSGLRRRERLKVLVAAATIRIAAAFENVRLRLGFSRERR